MEYVEPCYNHGDNMRLVQYIRIMQRYAVAANYMWLKYNNQNKGMTIHIDGRPKALRNIVGFIKTTWPKTTKKPPNYVFKGHEGNWVVVCAIKSLDLGESLYILMVGQKLWEIL